MASKIRRLFGLKSSKNHIPLDEESAELGARWLEAAKERDPGFSAVNQHFDLTVLLDSLQSNNLQPEYDRHLMTRREYSRQAMLILGTPKEKVDQIMKFVGDYSVEKSLKLVFPSAEGWEHTFVVQKKCDSHCMVCGEELDMHTSKKIKTFVEKVGDGRSRLKKLISRAAFSKENPCEICFEKYPMSDLYWLPCNHYYCFECLTTYFVQGLENIKNVIFSCPHPGCPAEYHEDFIKRQLSSESKERYERFVYYRQVDEDPNLRWCSSPKCKEVIDRNPKTDFVQCGCGHKMCFLCGENWHEGKECADVEHEGFKKWSKGRNVKRCPKCSFRIEKLGGCNHITCSRCSHDFCWLCGDPYDFDHYSEGRCAGKLFEGTELDNARIWAWPRWDTMSTHEKIGAVFLGILLLPFLLVLGPPLYMMQFIYTEHLSDFSLLGKVISAPFVFMVCIFLTILGYFLGIAALVVVATMYILEGIVKCVQWVYRSYYNTDTELQFESQFSSMDEMLLNRR